MTQLKAKIELPTFLGSFTQVKSMWCLSKPPNDPSALHQLVVAACLSANYGFSIQYRTLSHSFASFNCSSDSLVLDRLEGLKLASIRWVVLAPL